MRNYLPNTSVLNEFNKSCIVTFSLVLRDHIYIIVYLIIYLSFYFTLNSLLIKSICRFSIWLLCRSVLCFTASDYLSWYLQGFTTKTWSTFHSIVLYYMAARYHYLYHHRGRHNGCSLFYVFYVSLVLFCLSYINNLYSHKPLISNMYRATIYQYIQYTIIQIVIILYCSIFLLICVAGIVLSI